MSRLLYQQGTQQQAENIIVREQKDFSGGLFKDIPDIPDNAVAGLENFINRGTFLEGRSGSVLHSDIALPAEGDVNCVYYHKKCQKIILHLGRKLYIADPLITAWTEVVRAFITDGELVNVVPDSKSTVCELGDYAYVFTAGGIYQFDASSDVPYYLISNVVSQYAGSTAISTNESYAYRYRYVCRPSTFKGRWDVNRLTSQTPIEHEITEFVGDSYSSYYTEAFMQNAITASGVETIRDMWSYNGIGGTHVSIYRTLDVGTNGVNPTDGDGNNPGLYGWVEDVPKIKCFFCTVALNPMSDLEVTLGGGKVFGTYDIGSKLFINYGALLGTASVPISLGLDESGFFNYFVTTGYLTEETAGAVPCAIGTDQVAACSQLLKVVTFDSTFGVPVVGDSVFFSDGTIDYVTSVSETPGTFTVIESVTRTGQAVAWSPTDYSTFSSNRLFYDDHPDNVEDTTDATYAIRTRLSTLPLQRALFPAMPSGNLGVISNGFVFCANEGGSEIYYSNIPQDGENTIGSCDVTKQYDKISGKIKLIKDFSDKLIVFCLQSTYEIPTNTFSSIDDEVLGESIIMVTGKSEVDSQIGLIDSGAFQMTGRGNAIMVTNETAIRVFDGSKYSDSLSENRIKKDLANFTGSFSSLYSTLNGLYLFAHDATDKIFNMALYSDQGVGFNEVTGSVPFPTLGTGTLSVYDTNDKRYDLILDATDGLFYNIATFEGYQGSNLHKIWRDKAERIINIDDITVADGDALEVTFTAAHGLSSGDLITFSDVGGTVELNTKTYKASYTGATKVLVVETDGTTYTDGANFSQYTDGGYCVVGGEPIPYSVTFPHDKGTFEHYFIDHTASHFYFRPYNSAIGYPQDLQIGMSIFTDGETVTETTSAEDIKKTHEAVYEVVVSGNRLQSKIDVTGGPVLFVGRNQYYNSKDIPASPVNRIDTANIHQNLLANVSFWYTRPTPTVDRVTQNVISGTTALITGPDGKDESALSFTGTVGLGAYTNNGRGVVVFWGSGLDTWMTVGANSYVLYTHKSIGGWTLYYTVVVTHSGEVSLNTLTTGKLFDIRCFDRGSSSGATTELLEYVYYDMLRHGGASLLPLA